MFCGAELAWARIAVPACCRIWVLVKLTISAATSRSLMRDSEALRFSDATLRAGDGVVEAVLDGAEVAADAADLADGACRSR